MRFRITIARLIAAIGFIGVGLAALRFATELWASVVFTSTLLVLGMAAAYAAQRRGPRRAFWTAFVAFGTGYMILAFGPWFEASIRPRLVTSKLIDLAYPWLNTAPMLLETENVVRLWGPDATLRARFQTIGHSLFALLLAAIGGTVSSYFHANRDERRREAAEKAAGVLVRVLEAGL